LVIVNCPQITKLNIRGNLLTSLEFMKSLDDLEELEIEGNTKLVEILKPYRGS
jgi:Leucine-rich repeat (LRR) protein